MVSINFLLAFLIKGRGGDLYLVSQSCIVLRCREHFYTSIISIAASLAAHRTACFPLDFVPSSDAWFLAFYAT